MEQIATVLNESVGTVKNMAFKKRGLLSLTPEEIKARIQTISDVVEVREGGRSEEGRRRGVRKVDRREKRRGQSESSLTPLEPFSFGRRFLTRKPAEWR